MAESAKDLQAQIEALQQQLAEAKAQLTVSGERDVAAGRDIERAVVVSGDNNSVTQIIRQYRADNGAVDEDELRGQIADYLLWVRDRYGMIEMRGIRREGQQVVQLELETVYVPLEAQGYHGGMREAIELDQVLKVSKRLIITGGPGCGKTTVLQHVAWTLATAIALDQPELANEKLGLPLIGDKEDQKDKDRRYLFSVSLNFVDQLDDEQLTPELRKQFLVKSVDLRQEAYVEIVQVGSEWAIVSGEARYSVRRERYSEGEKDTLNVYDRRPTIPLPLFVPLSAYAQHRRTANPADPRAKSLAAFISHYLIEKQSGLELPDNFFERLLKTGQAVILLLDGLDEVPNESERIVVREAIENLVTGREEMRIAVTCRTAAHRGRSALGRGFAEIGVNPLDESHVQSLVAQAYRAVYHTDRATRAQKTADLLNGIRDMEAERKQRLGEGAARLIDSPLMVRMLLVVHLSERRMPQHRAELYMRATDTMLWPEYGLDVEAADRIGRLVGESHETHRELAQNVAFAMHSRGEQQGREIDEDGLRGILEGDSAFSAYVDDFIGLTRLRSTLLEERMGSYRFIHLAFQEYLAARYLAEVVRSEGGVDAIVDFLVDGRVSDSWWRESVLLVAGYFSLNVPKAARLFVRKLAGIEAVGEAQAERSPDIALAAAELAAIACLEWMSSDQEVRGDLVARLVLLIEDETLMNAATPLVRVAAGSALDFLGDPRDGVGVHDDLPQIAWQPVCGGPFVMGEDKSDHSDAMPAHEMSVPSFRIGRYPVTNQQYGAFLTATSHPAPKHWQGDKPPLGHRNRPVVYVNWDDASAFCAWLSHKIGQEVRLPSEAEWEKAAKGDGDQRRYPWGDEDPDTNRCNYHNNIEDTTPVGIYPAGGSPYGCLDMSGNVHEWTLNLRKAASGDQSCHPYRPDDGCEDVTASGGRVVRGGGFSSPASRVRCTFRGRGYQFIRNHNVGFRVVAPGLEPLVDGEF